MATRKTPLITNQFYHILNKSINKEPIFTKHKDCQRALITLDFYRFYNPPVRLSYYLGWGIEKKENLMSSLKQKAKELVEIISFCLMPNHFHLLLKQTSDEGISKFMGLVQNSYTRYFNDKHQRQGHLFQGQFKAIRVETDEQLLHLSRYIHLNPYSSFVVKSLEGLEGYPWSSLPEFLEKKDGFCFVETVLSHFPKRSNYRKFIHNNANYQRNLEKIKHITLD